LAALLKPNPLSTSSLLKTKETHSERFKSTLKQYDEDDYELLFSNNKMPSGLDEEEE
jgi:hypothetical protein